MAVLVSFGGSAQRAASEPTAACSAATVLGLSRPVAASCWNAKSAVGYPAQITSIDVRAIDVASSIWAVVQAGRTSARMRIDAVLCMASLTSCLATQCRQLHCRPYRRVNQYL